MVPDGAHTAADRAPMRKEEWTCAADGPPAWPRPRSLNADAGILWQALGPPRPENRTDRATAEPEEAGPLAGERTCDHRARAGAHERHVHQKESAGAVEKINRSRSYCRCSRSA